MVCLCYKRWTVCLSDITPSCGISSRVRVRKGKKYSIAEASYIVIPQYKISVPVATPIQADNRSQR